MTHRWDRKPEPPRTRSGLRIIPCHLFNGDPHGGHQYIRGDEKVVCDGIPHD